MDAVARHFEYEPNRAGYICCPFHNEKTPSLKIYPDGSGWHCFGCHRGGSVIDFTVELLSLTPLEAVRRLNKDFRLGLPLDRPPNKTEQEVIRHRQEINDTYRRFEQWRDDMIRRLNACFLEGHLAMLSLETPMDLDKLTDSQIIAIREQAHLEWLADVLTDGTMADMMAVFRERKEVENLCSGILSNTPTKSSVA